MTSGLKLSVLNATTASFTFSLRRRYSCSTSLSRDRQPLGDRGAQLVDDERAADAVFELGGGQRRTLHAEQLLIPLLADERAVLLERRNRQMRRRTSSSLAVMLQPLGFRERRPLVDQLLQDLLVDAELLQQLSAHVAAVGVPVGLDLRLVGAAEFVAADLVSLDDGDRPRGGGVGGGTAQEVGNVEDDKRQAHECQAPLEPVPMPAHPIEHGHCGSSKH